MKAKRIVFNVLPAKRQDLGSGPLWALSRRDGEPVEAGQPRVLYDRRKSVVVRKGRTLAQAVRPSQLVIHGADGKIQTEHTYGDDPRRTKG